jgi:hypothetical protein
VVEPQIYVYVHPAYTQTIFYTQTLLIYDSFRDCGAIVCVGDDFKQAKPNPGDQLVIYGNVDVMRDVVERFAPGDRWLYVVDESGAGQGAYDRSLGYMAKLNAKNIIVTYQNVAHLEKLRNAGVRYVIMPQTVPTIRPKIAKTHDILASGQLSAGIYPTRTRVIALLNRSSLAGRTQALAYPGCDVPQTTHKIYGDRYYQHLDGFRLGVTCRAGARDRFVAKYAEMAASHVLPIGDCPTYMPEAMKKAMVNVEGLNDDQIVAELTRLLNAPEELQARTEAFTAEVAQRYIALPNMQRVVAEIKQHQ